MFVVRPFQATTLSWWHSEQENLDLAPSYQRASGIWSPRVKAYLIDSILNGYDIPKFYIADFSYVSSVLNKKNRPYAVIDGRQRFEAIFDFLNNKFRLNTDLIYQGEENIFLANLYFRDIKKDFPKVAQRIENFNITVMSVITDQEERINELFVRLNSGKTLSSAEVRSARVGKVPDLIRSLAKTDFFESRVAFGKTRKQDESIAAKILLIEHRGGFVETKKTSLDRFAAEADLTESEFDSSAQRARIVLDACSKIFQPKDALLRTSGNVPIYYWLVKHHGDLSNLRGRIEDFWRFRGKNADHPAIITFNQANRSVNDEFSYRVRYNVIEKFVLLESGTILKGSDPWTDLLGLTHLEVRNSSLV